MFEHVRKTSLTTFVGVVLFVMLLPFVVWFVLPSEAWNQAVASSTAGLLEVDLLRDIFLICLVVTFVRIASGLRPRDLGLTSQLSRALAFTALLWVLTQGALAVWQISTTGQISWNSGWREPGPTFVFGELISQLFGNALFEEIVWRGFIFVQLFLFLERREVKRALLKSLLISQGLFALLHISVQFIMWSFTWSELFQFLTTLFVGVVLAVVYIKTSNLEC